MSGQLVLASDVIVRFKGKILLVKRGHEPYKGMMSLPGGRQEKDESIEETALREVKEETGLDVKLKEILGVYSSPFRDPRFHAVSVVFIADSKSSLARAGSDAEEVFWMKPEEIDTNNLAFDHGKMIRDYLLWKKRKQTFWSSKN
ncbi:MAG: NUDIX hydrolase [Candidatus Aenigmatarchaeota archaeon]